ncbi:hypothetical protein K474DRAFT_1681210 [Panus rudis PR-1116 ss-1]|nr:hypothetical protein K474DRAFT_1681210 [Panus rudis PR-1116 ss-1]
MEVKPEEDRLLSVLPIYYSNSLEPHLHLHQFPLLTRSLQVPPSAAASGKKIRARLKRQVKRLEVHVPVDSRPDVWNQERAKDLGAARLIDDKEKNQEPTVKGKQKEEEEPRLTEVRMRSENVPHNGTYVLGVVRDGRLYLHPISETHQLRPTLTYMDVLTRKVKRRSGAGSDDESDEGPPPDPDEPAPAPVPKREKKASGEVKEVQVSLRKGVDDKGMPLGGGITPIRREMLLTIRAEEDEKWEDYEFCDGGTAESNEAFESVFTNSDEVLECTTDITNMLKSIRGL